MANPESNHLERNRKNNGGKSQRQVADAGTACQSHRIQVVSGTSKPMPVAPIDAGVPARPYDVTLLELFHRAKSEYPSISIEPQVMAGAPCVSGTRIPIYMILDAVQHYGSVEGVKRTYSYLTSEQIKDAIGFAKLVVECPIEHNSPSFA